MINNARGSHVSPGVYTKEVEVTFTPEKINETTLGLVGETLKGPAFEPIDIKSWKEFKNYFGDTSAEKFIGTGYPKYELPYIAKEWLDESNSLKVCRVLGLSGYDAGNAWVVTGTYSGETYALAVLRSKKSYSAASGDICEPGGEELSEEVTAVKVSAYVGKTYDANCSNTGSGTPQSDLLEINSNNPGKFTLEITTSDGTQNFPVSLKYGDVDYIYKVLGYGPFEGVAPLYVEEVYDYAIKQVVDNDGTITIVAGDLTADTGIKNYEQHFMNAETPWIVSQAVASDTSVDVKKLFKVHTISDGDASNRQVKISIQNIRPDEGLFDFVVRSYNDSDTAPAILEKFSNCSMTEGTPGYIALKVGTVDGEYVLKSKYVAIELADGDHAGDVPCGFLGYNMHKFSDAKNFDVAYNTVYDPNIKPGKQYFGLSQAVGIDEDVLKYKGASTQVEQSKGFHLDSIFALTSGKTENGQEVWVRYTIDNNGNPVREESSSSAEGFTKMYKYSDGTYSDMMSRSFPGVFRVDGIEYEPGFDCVSPLKVSTYTRIPRIVTEDYMKETIYANKNVRKFTVYPAGGFDGWDIYQESRTNTDKYKLTKYTGARYSKNVPGFLDLPDGAFNSDYYAYLAGYRCFSNPEEQDICLFATPGIDAGINPLLIEEVTEMIEDKDERNGDALYIYTVPQYPEGSKDPYSPTEVVDFVQDFDSSYIATYWPWVKCYDSVEARYIDLPATKDVLRDMVYTDKNAQPWFCAAGLNRGDVKCVKACVKTKLADEDILYAGRINPIKTFAADGVKIWGNKTTYSPDSPLNRINARRLLIRLKRLVTIASRKLIFEQLDNSLENQFLSIVKPILDEAKQGRGIKKYKIEIDSSAEAHDEHTLPAKISVMPINALEYIDLTFTIYPESVDFEE